MGYMLAAIQSHKIMEVYRMKKNIKTSCVFSVIFSLLIICSCFAFAATSANVNITNSESVAHTGSIQAMTVKYSGHNNASSSRELYFETQYQAANGKWYTSNSLLMSPGNGFNPYIDPNSQFNPSTNWRLELNPYGIATRGCSGWGKIEKNT